MIKKTVIALAAFGLLASSVALADGPETKITARVFADFTSKTIENDKTGWRDNATGIGTDLKRFYIGISTKLDPNWSATFLTDVCDQNGKCDPYVKNAYLAYTYSPLFVIRAGAAPTPWEGQWEDPVGIMNTRYIEAPPTDRFGFNSSAEWGIHFLGKSAPANGMGWGYALTVGNGKGYGNPTRTKSVDFEGMVYVAPTKELQFAVGAYTGKKGNDLENSGAKQTATRFNVGGQYKNDTFGFFAEYWENKNWNTASTTSDSAKGYAGVAKVNFDKQWDVMVRYDSLKPSDDVFSDIKDTLLIGAVEYKPVKGVTLALVFKSDSYKNGGLSADPGLLGAIYPPSGAMTAAPNVGLSSISLGSYSGYYTPNVYAPGNKINMKEVGIFALYDF